MYLSKELSNSNHLTPTEKMVMAQIYAFNKRVLYIDQEKLAEKLGVSRRTIGNCLNSFHEKAYIHYLKFPNKRYKYVIILDTVFSFFYQKKSNFSENFNWIKNQDLKLLSSHNLVVLRKITQSQVTKEAKLLYLECGNILEARYKNGKMGA